MLDVVNMSDSLTFLNGSLNNIKPLGDLSKQYSNFIEYNFIALFFFC